MVDDFGIKYTKKEDADHLISALKDKYIITEDWSGKHYCGLTLDWHYTKKYVEVSMPGYVRDALTRFRHATPTTLEYAPHLHTPIKYGRNEQMGMEEDTDPTIPDNEKKFIQQVVGTFLYYARAVDATMLVALNEIASMQSKPTKNTVQKVTKFLNYCCTYPDTAIRYDSSDMILYTHSDASYLSVPKARSREGGVHFLSIHPLDATKPPDSVPPLNGPVLCTAVTMKNVLSSAAEAETVALFENAKDVCVLQHILTELRHDQSSTLIQIDNSIACGIANNTIKQKRSKAFDMRFYWIQDRVNPNQFHVYRKSGNLNIADYLAKHHAPPVHKIMRRYFVINIVTADDTARVCCNDHIRSGCNDPSSKVMTNYPVTSDITAIASRLQSLTDSHRLHYSRRLD